MPDAIQKHYEQIEAAGLEPGDLLPFDPPELGEGYTVNVRGSLATYPGIIRYLIPDTGRACVQWWCDVRKRWLTNGVDIDRLELTEHEIGACMTCGKYDWYAKFDDWCDCADCQKKRRATEDTTPPWWVTHWPPMFMGLGRGDEP